MWNLNCLITILPLRQGPRTSCPHLSDYLDPLDTLYRWASRYKDFPRRGTLFDLPNLPRSVRCSSNVDLSWIHQIRRRSQILRSPNEGPTELTSTAADPPNQALIPLVITGLLIIKILSALGQAYTVLLLGVLPKRPRTNWALVDPPNQTQISNLEVTERGSHRTDVHRRGSAEPGSDTTCHNRAAHYYDIVRFGSSLHGFTFGCPPQKALY
ncbi:unnamed protein product [Linum trigynum]|uniref:Uncharacterized protein n=1 Tax=Linum trigynum TaxID=586398 RepID=A0AAV2DH43_9ROSI